MHLNFLFFLIFTPLISCGIQHSVIENNVEIEVYTQNENGNIVASAMPKLRSDRQLNSFHRRFEYLLINVSKIHSPEKANKRKEIWSLYPDTIELKKRYLQEFTSDKKLEKYFQLTASALTKDGHGKISSFSSTELMEVASLFFYCDKVFPDTTIQSHVCIGLNGITEANLQKDYTLLEAFCYEAIFNDFEKDVSVIDDSYSRNKRIACLKYKSTINSLDQYLLDVRKELFELMKNDSILKESLLNYYERNKNNLSFQLYTD